MRKLNQDGVSGVAVSLVLTVLLLLGAIGFGVWAYGGRQDYKNNVDSKIGVAVDTAKQQEDKLKSAQFAEEEKNPLRTYNGPESYGSIALQYPKTWSGYVDTSASGSSSGNTPVSGYFYPGIVPSVADQNSAFALRVQVLDQPYAQTLSDFQNQQQSSNSPGSVPLTITPYALPKLPKVVGIQASGTLPGGNGQKTGTAVILPLRSETLEISTDGNQFLNDFNTIILPNFSFSP
ncbi:MAG: hypothetical protein WA843_03705 [Candidatus Saccharimonadales bacterium]